MMRRNGIVLVLACALPLAGLDARAAARDDGKPSEPAPTAKQQRSVAVTGKADRRLASFDRMMRAFLAEHPIPGAALAVAKDSRLVYARGFGYADVEHKSPVAPDALFRIASVSKPITAVAILKLVEQDRLQISDRVFEILGERFHLSEGDQTDPRMI